MRVMRDGSRQRVSRDAHEQHARDERREASGTYILRHEHRSAFEMRLRCRMAVVSASRATRTGSRCCDVSFVTDLVRELALSPLHLARRCALCVHRALPCLPYQPWHHAIPFLMAARWQDQRGTSWRGTSSARLRDETCVASAGCIRYLPPRFSTAVEVRSEKS